MAVAFSDTTNKDGLIQICEDLTGLGDAGISGDSTLLKRFTRRINTGMDEMMPYLLQYLRNLGFDDTNISSSGLPTKSINMVSGTNHYQILQDSNSLDILSIVDVYVLPSATDTDYIVCKKIDLNDPQAARAISPNADDTGTPNTVLIKGNDIFFTVVPSYNATNGIKITFNREQYRFTSSDTTKNPGVPSPFHMLPALIAAHEWIIENKPANAVLISRIEAKIAKENQQLADFVHMENMTEQRITPRFHSSR